MRCPQRVGQKMRLRRQIFAPSATKLTSSSEKPIHLLARARTCESFASFHFTNHSSLLSAHLPKLKFLRVRPWSWARPWRRTRAAWRLRFKRTYIDAAIEHAIEMAASLVV
jgi:hypothetical protein